MSTITQPLNVPTDIHGNPMEEKPGGNYINASKGILSWLLTLDHKRIALMYMVLVLGSFLIGGLFAIVLRTELFFPGPTLVADAGKAWKFYNQCFTLHGAVMVFMFIIPSIPAILGNFMLPLMLGAKDVAFPRLNLLSLYCYIAGAGIMAFNLVGPLLVMAIPGLHGWVPDGLDTGWTFYTPYSTGAGTSASGTSVMYATLGAFTLGFSSILTGLNFIATIHMMKPRGMGWFNMPLFLWGLYATSVIQILATPVLAITLLLLFAERAVGIGVFDPQLGGDPVLFQHFFWFYSHPAVYIMILPGMGVVSELISTFSRRHVFGYRMIAFSSVAIAIFGFIVWGHHMFTSGQSAMLNTIFSLLTMTVAIPSAIKVFNWLSTMYKGSIRLDAPMIYAMGFIWMFSIGGLTGLYLATLSTDMFFQDNLFVVAHFHYVMVGSMLFAFIGGMYYWFPKMFGRMYSETWARIGCLIVFVGFNLTFFTQFIAGTHGMPRRYADYLDQYTTFHQVATIGSYILTLGLFTVLGTWIHALVRGRRAPANPWGSNALEWHTPSPPPMHNFDHEPEGVDPYDYYAWKYKPEIDGYVVGDERETRVHHYEPN